MKYQPMFKKRAILDLRGLVLHSYYGGTAVDTVFDSKGKRIPSAVHAVRFFCENYLAQILAWCAPVQVIAVLEGGNGKARRQAFYPGYKSKEDESDPVLKEETGKAMEAVQRLLMGLGCLLVKTPGVEADDTIAYLVRRLKGYKRIYTVDKDLQQLHSPECAIYLKGQYADHFEGHNLAEVGGWIVTLHKSIVGDPSDGYVGVKGMGEKAWQNLVSQFGIDGMQELMMIVRDQTWEQIEDALAESDHKDLRKLYEAREAWHVAFKLATLHDEWCETTVAGKIIKPQWVKRLPSMDRLEKVLAPMGLSRLISLCNFERFMPTMTLAEADKPNLINMIKNPDVSSTPFVAFDWESYDSLKHPGYQEAKSNYVDVLNQVLTGGSFCWGDNLQHSIYIPVEHRDTLNWSTDVLAEILVALEERGIQTVAHNSKFEQTLCQTNLGYTFPHDRLPLDTSILSSYVNENEEAGLKLLSKSYLNYNQIAYSDVVPEGKDMRDISGQEVLNYGADDSFASAHLCVLFRTILECEETDEFATTTEPFFDLPLIDSFIKGIPIDYARLSELEAEDTALWKKTESDLRSLLQTHCSEINEDGFKTLWPEIESYQRAYMKSKGKEEDQIVTRLHELRAQIYEKCKYVHVEKPAVVLTKASLTAIAKKVGFTGIRSLKSKWISEYVDGFMAQLAAMQANDPSVEFSDDQNAFLYYLNEYASFMDMLSTMTEIQLRSFKGTDVREFVDWISDFYDRNPDMWEGDELNVGSSMQMAELLYGKMGLPILIRNIQKSDESVRSQFDLEGAPSTNEIALRTLMVELHEDDWRHKVLQAILTIRGIRTRYALYYKPYPLWESPLDGRIHPSIRNCGTITRRPSGSSPNILQVSKKDDGKTRSVFLPQPNDDEPELIVSIDFVQQELVIMAGESNDKNLRACYEGDNKRDVHSQTATAIMNMEFKRSGSSLITYETYTQILKDKDHKLNKKAEKTRKKYAKTTNFLLSYGGSAVGLARKIIVARATAEEFLEAFHHTYPGVQKFQEAAVAEAKRFGFVKTAYGNRKHCDGIFDKNTAIAAAWERQAINMKIQGCAADILKIVIRDMVLTDVFGRTGATLYAPVYDELVASVPASKVFEYCELAADIMELVIPKINIKLSTSVSIGKNWGEQHEIGTRPSEEVVNKTIHEIFNQQEKEAA